MGSCRIIFSYKYHTVLGKKNIPYMYVYTRYIASLKSFKHRSNTKNNLWVFKKIALDN